MFAIITYKNGTTETYQVEDDICQQMDDDHRLNVRDAVYSIMPSGSVKLDWTKVRSITCDVGGIMLDAI